MEELIEVIRNNNARDWFDYLNLILSTITIVVSIGATIINIWLVNKNTNKQIENQNKETYRPRLRMKSIKVVEHNSWERYLYAHSKKYENENNCIRLYANIELENIGNGIANDISFYMLHSGNKCLEIQTESKEQNQLLNSTLEIPKDKTDNIKFLFSFNKDSINQESEFLDNEDFIILICNYKDLNNNYKMLIGFILKKYNPFKIEYTDELEIGKIYNDGKYSAYYYQEDTNSYRGMVEKNIYASNYKTIVQDINNKN